MDTFIVSNLNISIIYNSAYELWFYFIKYHTREIKKITSNKIYTKH